MLMPKILVMPGSTRIGSHNVKLAALATKELTLIDADVTRISLADYPLPLYEAHLDARVGPRSSRSTTRSATGRRRARTRGGRCWSF